MPEIERENILASRLEEMQKIKDRLALNAMFKSAGMGGDEDDESDEEPTRKKREPPFPTSTHGTSGPVIQSGKTAESGVQGNTPASPRRLQERSRSSRANGKPGTRGRLAGYACPFRAY